MDLRGQLGYKGERGYSAYEIAVQNGYEGTEAEWVDSFLNAENYYSKSETDTLLVTKAAKTEVYLKDDYAVVTGTIEYEEGEKSKQVDLSYPTGFTQDNCIIVSIMVQHTGVLYPSWSTGTVMTNNSTVTGAVPCSVSLNENNIRAYFNNVYLRKLDTDPGEVRFNDLPDIDFKIVLLKFDFPTEEEGD